MLMYLSLQCTLLSLKAIQAQVKRIKGYVHHLLRHLTWYFMRDASLVFPAPLNRVSVL